MRYFNDVRLTTGLRRQRHEVPAPGVSYEAATDGRITKYRTRLENIYPLNLPSSSPTIPLQMEERV